jgi:long-chain fatty acid transport protein
MRTTLSRLAPLMLAAFAGQTAATNGYFSHGYGIKAKGMGGAAIALAQDRFGGANNPAAMAFAGGGFDAGLELFMPRRDAERAGAGFPTLNGKVDSDKTQFWIPELAYNRKLGPGLAAGVTVYGNGGMNTTFPEGSFNCGGGAANMLCGRGTLGVDMSQLVVAPTVAYQVGGQHAFGAALLLAWQRFKITGAQAFDNAPGFPPFTGRPGAVTNNGYDNANGVGVRLGYQGRLGDTLAIGAAYAPKLNMGRFDRYAGLFAGNGDFDIPAHYGIGTAFTVTPALTVAADWLRIKYSGVASVGNASSVRAPLGSANGPGFGWQDIDVFKLGVSWRASDALTLRAGYNRGDNPITAADVSFNILAPGVMKDHWTFGWSWAADKASEFTGFVMVAPRQSVSGASLFNALLGPGAGGNETIRMKQYSVGVGWSSRF